MKLAAAALSALLAAAPTDAFRYSRPIQAPSGWVRLELPDDVLDACRPGLPDLRIADDSGREIPYAVEDQPSELWKSFPALNLESEEKVETVFQVDRGRRPGVVDAVTLEIAGTEFLKPVRVQSSNDRASWMELASGSIFATGDVRMTTLPLPPTDRRYLQFRLDDRNGPPVRPEGARLRARSRGDGEAAAAERPLALETRVSEAAGKSRYWATLPAANLEVTALRFQAGDDAFSRPVRVYERVFFRDEVHRRLVAAGVLSRAPDERGPIDLAVHGIAGRNLEIEIGDGDSPPLEGLRAAALARSVSLRFQALDEARLTLLYGSPSVRAPRYDLGRALAGAAGGKFAKASLGPIAAARTPAPAVAVPPRAPLADPGSWSVRRSIVLPAEGHVAYLDFDDLPDPAEVRIVDTENYQVPFIAEGGSHEHARKIGIEAETSGATTRARLDGLPPEGAIDAVELRAIGPDYFSRPVRIEEEERDARGVTGTRTLGEARWERRPGEPPPILRIPIARPRHSDRVFAVIENGDNVPLTLSGARALTSVVRLDFVFRPGETLTLLRGNPKARPPAYDLAMVAPAVLSAPAGAARLGPATPTPAGAEKTKKPAWFWAAVSGAVLLLLFQLRRALAKRA